MEHFPPSALAKLLYASSSSGSSSNFNFNYQVGSSLSSNFIQFYRHSPSRVRPLHCTVLAALPSPPKPVVVAAHPCHPRSRVPALVDIVRLKQGAPLRRFGRFCPNLFRYFFGPLYLWLSLGCFVPWCRAAPGPSTTHLHLAGGGADCLGAIRLGTEVRTRYLTPAIPGHNRVGAVQSSLVRPCAQLGPNRQRESLALHTCRLPCDGSFPGAAPLWAPPSLPTGRGP